MLKSSLLITVTKLVEVFANRGVYLIFAHFSHFVGHTRTIKCFNRTSRITHQGEHHTGGLFLFFVTRTMLRNFWKAMVQLEEDAVVLWLAALRNSPVFNNATDTGLLRLFPMAINLLSTNLDLLGSLTDILESYFLLAAGPLLSVSGYSNA